MSIPSLCIHLDTERDAFKLNKENHLKPILASSCVDQLFGEGIISDKEDVYNVSEKNYLTFLDRIATDLNLDIDQIMDFEFNAYDTHMPAITGLHKEFISSPRLDNLASSLCSIDALVEHYKKNKHDNADVSIIMLFDHEEVGSTSA